MLVLLQAGIINKMDVRIANRNDPDQILIWVCTVYLGCFGRQLVFEILGHLPYIYATCEWPEFYVIKDMFCSSAKESGATLLRRLAYMLKQFFSPDMDLRWFA